MWETVKLKFIFEEFRPRIECHWSTLLIAWKLLLYVPTLKLVVRRKFHIVIKFSWKICIFGWKYWLIRKSSNNIMGGGCNLILSMKFHSSHLSYVIHKIQTLSFHNDNTYIESFRIYLVDILWFKNG